MGLHLLSLTKPWSVLSAIGKIGFAQFCKRQASLASVWDVRGHHGDGEVIWELLRAGVVVGVTKAHIVDVPRTRIMLHFARLSSIYINVSYIYIPLSSIYTKVFIFISHMSPS